MSKTKAFVGSFAFLVLAPGTVAGLIPWLVTGWEGSSPVPLQLAGVVLALTGLAQLLHAFGRFALQGLGTPAPVAPTQHLVITGAYRHVRNPMYLAVVAIVVSQAALFGSAALLAYGCGLLAVFAAFVKAYEEPTLARQFGADYDAYRRAVPGWWPRIQPWEPDSG